MSLGFTVKKIAEDGLLGGKIHPNTLYKLLKEHDLQVRSSYSTITDDQLEEKVAEYNREHPNAGAMEVHSYLKTQGISIQRDRCRAVLTRVDSAGAAKRWSCTIQRRQYKVPTANSIWHLDTHHSLGRWGIVVHGGIDGHSRLMPFLRASTFNTAKAAACFFVQGVNQFGLPSRVRAHHGTEYVDIGRFMIAVNGEERGSFITGPSVHNQRIERQWRDVFCKVLDTYYKLFCLMEEHKLLNITNNVHRWILHYVFLPRIDLALREWTETHNNHKVRTEHNQSPNMMWFQSLLLSDPEKHTGVRNIEQPPQERIQQTMQNLNIDFQDEQYLHPRDPCPFSVESLANLHQSIDLKRHSLSHGMDIYGEVLQLVSNQTN
ncbi:uncharacterized protein LOC143063230 [Mytilus galloprovincialis]|uniref:uncharacterized protein LOC143063230 n=1 Tax=Mytilus galloprovincialis TaxID=29158 RepID=UPI003F7C4E32